MSLIQGNVSDHFLITRLICFLHLACDHTSPLQELITERQNRRDVYFKDHAVNDDNICLLAKASKTNKNIWEGLNLWNNALGPDSAVYINQILENGRLRYIHLGRNLLGYEGLSQLQALKRTRSLTELDLWDNHVGDRGMTFLAQVLPHTRLARLNLGVNEIGNTGCKLLFPNLPNTLTKLDLFGNHIGESCLYSIKNAISKGFLRELNLEGEQSALWSEKSKQELKDVAKDNECRLKL